MATELEIRFIDDGGEDGTGQPIDTQAAGAPVGGHSQLETDRRERDADAPKSEHFRGLTTAIENLTKRLGGERGFTPAARGVKPETVGPTVRPSARSQQVNDQVQTLADRINDRIGGAVESRVPKGLRGFVQPALNRARSTLGGGATPGGAAPSRPTGRGTGREVVETLAEKALRQDAATRARRAARESSRAARAARAGTAGRTVGTAGRATTGRAAAETLAEKALRQDAETRARRTARESSRAARAARAGTAGRTVAVGTAGRATAGRAAAGTAGRAAVAGTAGRAAAGGALRAGGAALAALGPVGIAVGVVTVALLGMARVVGVVNDRFKGMADRVAEFSGPVAGQRARNEAARTIQRIEFAQRVGPQVARVERARGELNRSIQSLKDAFDTTLADLAPILEKMLQSVAVGVEEVKFLKEAGEAILRLGLSEQQNTEALDALKDLGNSMKRLLDLAEDEEGGSSLDIFLGTSFQGRPNPIPPPNRPQPDNIPANARPIPPQ